MMKEAEAHKEEDSKKKKKKFNAAEWRFYN